MFLSFFLFIRYKYTRLDYTLRIYTNMIERFMADLR
jgi:hypothetical protein